MSDDTPEVPVAPTPDEEEFTRQCELLSLHLRLGRLPLATQVADDLLARWPDRTTTHELVGDVALSQGKVAAARKHYQQALQIEPANVDAERKYGLALVTQTPDERRAALIGEVIKDPTAHRASSRKPVNAVLNALLFPGFGQLYNREHEKGLTMLGVAAVLVMLAFHLIVQVPYSAMVESTQKHGLRVHEQLEGSREAMNSMGGGYWLLVILVILAYVALYAWGIYDAWRQGQSETERVLGIH